MVDKMTPSPNKETHSWTKWGKNEQSAQTIGQRFKSISHFVFFKHMASKITHSSNKARPKSNMARVLSNELLIQNCQDGISNQDVVTCIHLCPLWKPGILLENVFPAQISWFQSEAANMPEFPRDSNKIHSISFGLEKLDPKLCRGRYQMLLCYSPNWQSPTAPDIDPTFSRNWYPVLLFQEIQ